MRDILEKLTERPVWPMDELPAGVGVDELRRLDQGELVEVRLVAMLDTQQIHGAGSPPRATRSGWFSPAKNPTAEWSWDRLAEMTIRSAWDHPAEIKLTAKGRAKTGPTNESVAAILRKVERAVDDLQTCSIPVYVSDSPESPTPFGDRKRREHAEKRDLAHMRIDFYATTLASAMREQSPPIDPSPLFALQWPTEPPLPGVDPLRENLTVLPAIRGALGSLRASLSAGVVLVDPPIETTTKNKPDADYAASLLEARGDLTQTEIAQKSGYASAGAMTGNKRLKAIIKDRARNKTGRLKVGFRTKGGGVEAIDTGG